MAPPIAEILNYRQYRAYRRTFDRAATHGGEVSRVLGDLAEFCCATRSTASSSPEDLPILEGRRQVWLRIQHFLNLDEADVRRTKSVVNDYFGGIDDDDDE